MELYEEIKTMAGVGPKKAHALARLSVREIGDLLYLFPRTYEDRRNVIQIENLWNEECALVRAQVVLIAKGGGFGRKRNLKLLVQDESGSMEVLFFHSAYLERAFQQGEYYSFFGKAQCKNGKKQMLHPDFEKWTGDESQEKILPVYPLVKGLSQKDLRKWTARVLLQVKRLNEYIPEETLGRNRLCGLHYALQNIHYPDDPQKVKEARFRFVFEELFLLQTGLLMMKNRVNSSENGISFSSEADMKDFTDSFPYPLTGAQKRVLEEIRADMESPRVMNRLVQGDVGSGKTAVAAAALYKAARSGYQAVLMAPTEILARQHFTGLSEQFAPFGLRTGFLSGSLPAKEKRLTLEQLAKGEIDVLVGTHAVIQEDVVFARLGLVITDEQHRFGVKQRGILTEKGENPDVLVMTATPIPRTLAMTLYGDLDISIIDEMPPGRQQIITRAVNASGRESAYQFILRQVQEGRQAYIVAPLIEESMELSARSAQGVYEELTAKFPDQRSALLHGAMKQKDKDRIMEEFYEGKTSILVSTVVIEVGINVPNATVILIENAERFGLAQLHQLRGRVGRGKEQSYCILITEGQTEVAKKRAEIMKQSNDGFVIAEKDLELRGPGEFFGMRQHGVPELRIADLVKHVKILQKVKAEAEIILSEDPTLSEKKNELLRQKIEKTFENVENPML